MSRVRAAHPKGGDMTGIGSAIRDRGACVNTRLAGSLRVILESGAGRDRRLGKLVGDYCGREGVGRLRPAVSAT